jgi:hypothetical protein
MTKIRDLDDAPKGAPLQNSFEIDFFSSLLGALAKAQLIAKCRKRMIDFARKQPDGFFIANVDKQGKIELRMDKKGQVHGGVKQ